jgi:fructose-1,6-bisphosphatase/inositol monophosphatase family enzyme
MPRKEFQPKLASARDAVEALGPALLSLRSRKTYARYLGGDPYKTSADRSAEAWVVEYLSSLYPADAFLAEEAFEQRQAVWTAPAAYWTVDALDGTASFVDGFDGFCIQVAYVVDGAPVLGVIHEPVRRMTYWAIRGTGAYREGPRGKTQKLKLKPAAGWPRRPIFIDSTRPKGAVGQLFTARNGRFLECGSTGVKICRVAEGKAQVLAKPNRYKLWDIAPGHLILAEAGGRLALWDGSEVPYHTTEVHLPNMLAAPKGLFPLLVEELARYENKGS